MEDSVKAICLGRRKKCKYIFFRFPKFKDATEETTKLAFTIVTHEQLGVFEILLHLIFRPYNAYCIYVGSNTPNVYRENVEKLVNCYKYIYPESTIFMAENVHPVKWGNWSLIQADLLCMEHFLELDSQ